jgi:hypothetical protein
VGETGIPIGDFTHDYTAIFRELEYEPIVDVVGVDGIRQFVTVGKAWYVRQAAAVERQPRHIVDSRLGQGGCLRAL